MVGSFARGIPVADPGRDTRPTDLLEAVKVGPTQALDSASRREVEVLRELRGRHVGITQLHEVHSSEGRIEILLEYCGGGDLASAILTRGSIPERAAKVLFRQLVSAVAFCHSAGVMHRDIKPENVLFDQDPTAFLSNRKAPPVQVKLADLGVAVHVQGDETVSGDTGTKFYSAPEVSRGLRYGVKADIWSLGVVLYAMIAGNIPSADKTKPLTWFWMDILKAKVNLDHLHSTVTLAARNILRRMLQVDPDRRPTAVELLAHPWLTS